MSAGSRRAARAGARADEPRRTLLICRGTVLWGILLLAALIFTQALRSPLSSIFFIFVLMLPVVMLLYLLTARAAIKVYMLADDTTVEKNTPFSYAFRVINDGPLPYPFADAYVSLPQENRVRCATRTLRMTLSPFSACSLQNRVTFRYRGTYQIGVSCIYVYDFFRLFALRVEFNLYDMVYVTPKRRLGGESTAFASDDAIESNRRSASGYDKLEASGVREYRMGDALKSVHWKLSSKADDLIVRDYQAGASRMVYLYCDLSARYPDAPPAPPTAAKRHGRGAKAPAPTPAPDPHALAEPAFYEDMNEFIADGVVELTIAAALRELRAGNECTLLWFDTRAPQGAYARVLHRPEDFELIWKSFSTAPLCAAGHYVTRLPALLTEIQAARQIFITGCLDEGAVSALCALPGVMGGSVELLFYHPVQRFADRTARRRYLDLCMARLAEHGILCRESGSPAGEGGVR